MFKWVQENNYMNNPDEPKTHHMMSGGNLSIPDDNFDEFLHLYAEEVDKGNKDLTICEIRSPVSKMYFDIDILDSKALDDEYIIRIASIIQNSIVSCYQDDDIFQCVICTTPPKDSTDGLKKNGIHLIFPSLYVDREKALKLIETAVSGLEKSFEKNRLRKNIIKLRQTFFKKERFDYCNMSTLDSNELEHPLLSEFYARFIELSMETPCPDCTDGKVMEYRIYMPKLVLDSYGFIDSHVTDLISFVLNIIVSELSL